MLEEIVLSFFVYFWNKYWTLMILLMSMSFIFQRKYHIDFPLSATQDYNYNFNIWFVPSL